MNRQEAFNILGLPATATLDEIGKTFRTKAAKKHPDVCKEPGAEEEFKKLSAAYEYLKINFNRPENPFGQSGPVPHGYPGGANPFADMGFDPFSGVGFNLNDFFSTGTRRTYTVNYGGTTYNYRRQIQTQDQREHKFENINLSFKDFVFGTTLKIKVQRTVQCKRCPGTGEITGGSCDACGGKGSVSDLSYTPGGDGYGFKTKVIECSICSGTGIKKSKCIECKGGSISVENELSVKVPPNSNDKLRIPGFGNFINLNKTDFAQGDLFITLSIDKPKDILIEGANLVSTAEISLLDAIRGKSVEVDTVEGKKFVEIPKYSKNKDEIALDALGFGRQGKHIVRLDVKYPNDIESLEKFLEKE